MDNKKERVKYSSDDKKELEKLLRKIEGEEQVYSIALFDILGFSNFVENNGNQVVLDLYEKLVELINKQRSTIAGEASFAGSVVPMRVSDDWKSGVLIAGANGFINVCHFSDTFIIYMNYHIEKGGFWLQDKKDEPYPLLLGELGTAYSPIIYEKHHLYLSFLRTCMEFFCQSIIAGIPLRGCISTGFALMDSHKSIYFGDPLVEAARGEAVQNAIGIAFGKSFNNYHPVYNDYFMPYKEHIKENDNASFLSPMVPDWARYWRENPDYKDYVFSEVIEKMNREPRFSSYYDNAIKFFDFSEKHQDWACEINRDGIVGITDYYERIRAWYKSVV